MFKWLCYLYQIQIHLLVDTHLSLSRIMNINYTLVYDHKVYIPRQHNIGDFGNNVN